MKEGVVVILDILGMKGIWTRESPENIIKKCNYIKDTLEENVKTFSNLFHEEKFDYTLTSYSFSDTIIITIDSASFQSLIDIAGLVGDLFAIAIEKGILFRGSISIGDYYPSENMLLGPAIDDAAEWYDEADWAGIHLTPNASYFVDKNIDSENINEIVIENILLKHDIPMKNNKIINCWVVNWPKIFLTFDEEGKKTNASAYRNKILEVFSKHPIGIKEEPKYSNTLLFYDLVIE